MQKSFFGLSFMRELHTKALKINGKQRTTMTHNIHELRFDSILPDLKVTGEKQVFQNLSAHIEKLIGTPSDLLMNELENQKHDCAIGKGIAIPHAKLPRLTKPLIVFTRITNPINFNAADRAPVDLVCLVLSPMHDGPIHLRRLAKVSRFFKDSDFCNALRQAQNSDEIKSILTQVNKQRLAA